LIADGQETVKASYTDVVEAGDAGVEEFGGDGGFFGDGEVAGAGADYGDVSFRFGVLGLAEGDGSGLRVVDGGGDRSEDGFGGGFVGAGGQDVGAGCGHAGEDFGGLGGGFSGGVDYFGEADAEPAVVIDAGVAKVFEGEVGETL
jgi:hypothetical protein